MEGNKSSANHEYDYDLIGSPKCSKKPKKTWKKAIFWITLGVFKVLLLLFIIIFIVFPLVYKYTYSIQRSLVFLNFANWPKNSNLTDPKLHDLNGTIHLYLNSDKHIKLGVWVIMSENVLKNNENVTLSKYEDFLNNGENIILYNHGNAGTRASSHRIELYKVLRKNFHIIAFDYRSYGDSSNVDPTEEGLVDDIIYMYTWITKYTDSFIFVWGHSLGTSLSLHAISELPFEIRQPNGIILESPFNNMKDEIAEHPLASMFASLPWFHSTIVEPMQQNNFTFRSDFFINKVNCPILILHAKDDKIVPYKLGYKLYHEASKVRNLKHQGSIELKTFPSELKYGHKYICRAPELNIIILKFIDKAIQENKEKRFLT